MKNNLVSDKVSCKETLSLLLDSSLIFASKNKKYDIKIIQCGDYYQVYYYKNKKIIKDKNIVIDKKNFLIRCNLKKIKKILSKEEIKIKKEWEKFYSNPMYNFHFNSNLNIKEIDTDDLRKNNIDNDNEKYILLRNINRAKFQLQRIVKSNLKEFKTFITLTFGENITNIDEANHKFHIWRSNIQRIKKDFKYVCVPEFQKRGAVHYHLLTNIDYNDTTLLSLEERHIYNKNSGWQVGKDIKGWKYGHNMAKNMENINVIGYITKYMTKDIDNRLWGKHRYLHSRNLVLPVVVYLDLDKLDEFSKYVNICNLELSYNNTYLTKYNELVEFKEYKKTSS